jgi:hypothetical protein
MAWCKLKDIQLNGQKEKGQNDKHRQTITQKTKDRAIRTPLKTGDELRLY